MTRRIVALSLGQGAVVVAALVVLLDREPIVLSALAWPWFVGYAVVVTGLCLLPPIHLEHRRHTTGITPADLAIPVGLVLLGPVAFIGASMLAEVVLTVVLRAPPIKALYNLVSMLGGFVAAALVFALLGPAGPAEPRTWVAAVAALVACSLWDLVSSSWVLSIVEGDGLGRQLARNAPPILTGLGLAAAVGLVALLLLVAHGLVSLLLLVPILAVLVASSRGIAYQQAERQRFEQLYAASSTLAQLVTLPDMLGLIAAEARGLTTGAAGVCWLVRPDGTWTGRIVDDTGERQLSPAAHRALLARIPTEGRGEVDLPDGLGDATDLPPAASLVWAATSADPVGAVILVVLRELATDVAGSSRPAVLGAFITHAAAVVVNVELYQEVRVALAREVERNREKSEFVAAVSHELRTPLAAILGSVQTLRRLGDRLPPPETGRLIEIALAEGDRLKRLIEDLLLVAAREHAVLRASHAPLDLPALLHRVVDEATVASAGRVELTVDPSLGPVVSDADKLHRIVANLVVNATKYAPDGPIELTAEAAGDHVVIAVSDHGPGIPPADRERVFERFVQLDQSSTRRQGGTGLGLHLSRELATVIGASLTVGGAASGGARFELKVPLAAAEGQGGSTGGASTAPAGDRRSGIRARPASLG